MEIYESLREDHIKIKGFLEELVSLRKDDDYHMIVVQQIVDDFIPHARAEEAIFYNAIRAMSDESSHIMPSFKEHVEIETLLRTLQIKDRMDFDWKETAKKLKVAIEHHIESEEAEVFAHAHRMFSAQEAIQMNTAFEKLKEEIEGHGFMQSSFDMVKNLMPPKFVEKMKSLRQE